MKRNIFSIALLSALIGGGCLTSVSHLSAASVAVNDADRGFLFWKKKKINVVADSAKSKSEYDKISGGKSKISNGVFNVIAKNGEYYFEIPLSLMGRDMLVVNKFLKVPAELNEAGANRGLNFSNMMINFELDKERKQVLVRQSRPLPDVDNEDAIAKSVADNYISPIMANFKLEAFNNDSTAVVIKVNDIYDGTKTSFNNVFKELNLGTSPDSKLSRIKNIKAFDNNIYAVSELTTKVVEPGGTVYVTVEVGSTLLLLPEKKMNRRFVSPRVGYFSEARIQYGDNQQRVNNANYITRWRLEPKPEEREAYLAGKLVEPAKPITFWLDNSTPKQWRKYIRQGMEDWNSAFELAGFKNAIQVRQIQENDSIDMDDVNYSVLTYAASQKSNAMGPSLTDPRTGEILEADIMWWHNVLDILRDWIVVQTGAVDPRVRQAELPEEVIGDAMRFVACHEVGHSLGLRHNMLASAAIPTESLRNPEFMKNLGGTSSSIMDYARFNYVAQPGDDVKNLSPQIGPYDRMAIEYGYRWFGDEDNPRKDYDKLMEWLENFDNPLYDYSEAQDYREALDPRALSEDLGDNSVKSAKYGVANLKRIVPNVVNWTSSGEKGQDYDDASRLLYSAINQWQTYAYHVLANVGGMYVNNTLVGDGKITYKFVEPERQREAVKYLIDEVYTYPAWLFNADATKYTYLVRNTPAGRFEYSPNYLLKNSQSFLIWDMLENNRLVRMYENEAQNPKTAFKASEMMDMLHNSIFASTIKGIDPDVRERSMQKNFVDALMIAANESQGVNMGKKSLLPAPKDLCTLLHDHAPELTEGPEHADKSRSLAGERDANRRNISFYGSQANRISDALSVKRGELLRIKKLISARIPSAGTDAKYHYEDLLMRINTALGTK